jgi:two-component system response regulator DesR
MDIDVDRYGVDGFDSAQSLADQVPQCRVLVVADRLTAVLVRRALAAGVWGIAGPDTSPEQLAQAIRQVAAGERAIGPALAALALQPVENPLSDRQRVVLALAGEGLPAREIARRLFLSPGTVRNYLSVAMTKTGARNRLDAVRRAREEGWL